MNEQRKERRDEGRNDVLQVLRSIGGTPPVVVWVVRVVAILDDTHKGGQLRATHLIFVQIHKLLVKVEAEDRQRVALCFFCKSKDVELPICLSILHTHTVSSVNE